MLSGNDRFNIGLAVALAFTEKKDPLENARTACTTMGVKWDTESIRYAKQVAQRCQKDHRRSL